ncbi:paraneoplastic antigen Ma1 homolog [Paramisgurnus dabryanus]|uniref:paraneoplastic antigen Ma1 homolog n=1 Tax=Paramisgurnus dabryanus TaxID=90735 RepID=UPI0031F434FF
MESLSHSDFQEILTAWCDEVLIDKSHALVLVGVSAAEEVAHIEEITESVKVWGRVRVRATKTDPNSHKQLVLCETREVVNPALVPVELLSAAGEEPWKVVVYMEKVPSSTEFAEKLAMFLAGEGKSLTDVQALLSSQGPSASSPEAIIRAVGDLLEKTGKPSNTDNVYRRLRIFSGTVPTPPGEETLDGWIDQARMMIAECECSEKEKRRRVVESLKGSALEIIKAVRFSNPEASVLQYIEALESTFGTSESGEDLYFAFRLLRQCPGEALSDFLRRMDKALNKVVQKGGVSLQMVDRVRVEQLIRGAVESDLMLLQLRLRERKTKPPTFLTLLNEIREAEENEAVRKKIRATVKSVHSQEDDKISFSIVKELKAEIKDLATRIGQGPSKTSAASMRMESEPTSTKAHVETSRDLEVHSLKEQIQQLQQKISVMSVAHNQLCEQTQRQSSFMPRTRKDRARPPQEDFFCYRCGEDGHIATKCQAPENLTKVIQKLVRSLRKAKCDRKEMSNDSAKTENSDCFSKKSQIDALETACLP